MPRNKISAKIPQPAYRCIHKVHLTPHSWRVAVLAYWLIADAILKNIILLRIVNSIEVMFVFVFLRVTVRFHITGSEGLLPACLVAIGFDWIGRNILNRSARFALICTGCHAKERFKSQVFRHRGRVGQYVHEKFFPIGNHATPGIQVIVHRKIPVGRPGIFTDMNGKGTSV